MQTRKNLELSIILTSLIFHCELARINFCPPRSSTGKWVVLRSELGGNAVDEKSVAVGIGVGYQEDPRWAKKSTPPVRGGGDFEKPPELYCRYWSLMSFTKIAKLVPLGWTKWLHKLKIDKKQTLQVLLSLLTHHVVFFPCWFFSLSSFPAGSSRCLLFLLLC